MIRLILIVSGLIIFMAELVCCLAAKDQGEKLEHLLMAVLIAVIAGASN